MKKSTHHKAKMHMKKAAHHAKKAEHHTHEAHIALGSTIDKAAKGRKPRAAKMK